MKSEDLEKRLTAIFSKTRGGIVLNGLQYQESLLSSFLIQTLKKRNKSWSFKECVVADYVDLQIPVGSESLLKKCNECLPQKSIHPNKVLRNNPTANDVNYLIASKAYLKFLRHPDSRRLIANACDIEDLKAITYIDLLLDRFGVSKCASVIRNGACIEEKVKQLANLYAQEAIYQQVKEEATKIRSKYCNFYEGLIKDDLSQEKVQKFRAVKEELSNILIKFDSLSANIRQGIYNEYTYIKDISFKIDSVFKSYETNVDVKFKSVNDEFKNGVWNTNARIEKLRNLSLQLKNVEKEYVLILSRQGIEKCKTLYSEMKEILGKQRAVKYIKEDIIDKGYTIRNYKKEIKNIFRDVLNCSDMDRLNKIYSDLLCYKNQEYDRTVLSKDWLSKHYGQIGDTLEYLESKVNQRRKELKSKCDLYINRKNSWWTNLHHNFSVYNRKKLEEAWKELEVWKKCQVP